MRDRRRASRRFSTVGVVVVVVVDDVESNPVDLEPNSADAGRIFADAEGVKYRGEDSVDGVSNEVPRRRAGGVNDCIFKNTEFLYSFIF